VIRDLERDTAVVALGADTDALSLVCDGVIEVADGMVIGSRPPEAGARSAAIIDDLPANSMCS